MLAYANLQNIPVWTEIKLLDFIKMKDEASFSNIRCVKNTLIFDVNSGIKNSNGLTFMVPAKYKGLIVKKISRDGNDTGFITRFVKGSEYAFVTLEPGINHSIIVNY